VIYFCSQANRRELVLSSQNLNGIDYLEVLGEPGCGTQLAVTFLKDASPLGLTTDNVNISGGAAVTASSIEPIAAENPTVVVFDLDHTGDFSTYTFALVAGPESGEPPPGMDPVLASVEFSFKAGCPTPADCLPSDCCPANLPAPPDINYLAKDYPGFLQVMRDRLAVLTPAWTETHAADLGVAITEALAYAADHLSYQQDAVSTEAYIDTARSRISLRRHARLVDYQLGEGCNARTLVALTTATDGLPIPAETLFYTGAPGLPCAARDGDPVAQQLADAAQPVFTAMRESVLYLAHNEIHFYTWSDTDCCLPQGATQATLEGTLSRLAVGDMLIFEEVLGPGTGQPEDADPGRRCAVCLTAVSTTGPGGATLVDPLTGTPVTQIAWATADALPFPLCISCTTDAEHGSQPIAGVSVARANVVPADHGVWLSAPGEELGTVPAPPPTPVASAGCSCGADTASAPLPRFYPSLARSPLTLASRSPATTDTRGRRSRTFFPAAPPTGRSLRRSSTMGPSSCASATASMGWRPTPASRSAPSTGSATAPPGTSGTILSPTPCCPRPTCLRWTGSRQCATRCPPPAASTPRRWSTYGSSRRSPTRPRSGVSPKPTTVRRPRS
jgi:hypothetical protein